MQNMIDLQKKFDQCVLANPTSYGGSYTRSVKELTNSKAKSDYTSSIVTYLVIPEVSRGVANIRNFLEHNCLLRNSLGQYVLSEPKLHAALERINVLNVAIKDACDSYITDYDAKKSAFETDMAAYLPKQVGQRKAKTVLKEIMLHFPSKSTISSAAISLSLDYIAGTNGLSENTIKVVDESKAMELSANYQNMVLRAIEPTYTRLGQLINQDVEDKMSERTLNAYRNGINQLKDDNIIVQSPLLSQIVTCGFMAVGNSDYAEMLLTCIYRMAKDAGISEQLPSIDRYNTEMLNNLAEDAYMPSIEELVAKVKKAEREEVDE